MRNAIATVIAVFVVCATIYGFFWVAKRVSYAMFYESFVQDTVRQMVKPEALK